MYTYFIILNDYGIRPTCVWQLALNRGPYPGKNDKYNYLAGKSPNRYGHSRYRSLDSLMKGKNKKEFWDSDEFADKTTSLGWDYTRNGKIDIRLFYSYKTYDAPSIREPDQWT